MTDHDNRQPEVGDDVRPDGASDDGVYQEAEESSPLLKHGSGEWLAGRVGSGPSEVRFEFTDDHWFVFWPEDKTRFWFRIEGDYRTVINRAEAFSKIIRSMKDAEAEMRSSHQRALDYAGERRSEYDAVKNAAEAQPS